MSLFSENEFALLIDTKGRKYLVKLKKDAVFSFHKGNIKLNEIIGKPDGSMVTSSMGEKLIVFRPTLEEYILKMQRGAQIIYPKDISRIITLLDIFPGAKVFEAGTGSGALTMYLLRAVCPSGKVISYEKREDFYKRAKENIERFIPPQMLEALSLQNRDISAGIDDTDFDRAILDLTEPWLFLDRVVKNLKQGGILGCYLTTVLQIYSLMEEVEKNYDKTLYKIGIFELLERNWEKEGLSLRPSLRMVAHTGFIVVFRKIG
ncbi:tRNA (adenine-N1)-methyltransferase [Thermodesulfovibrio sp.]|uniref:tRNA (adenine-N1)-methyltransferase n=1 Tax=Thermodesulfovibrio sp. TaxID=2067987 RepID=UPI0030AA78DE